MSQRLFLRLEEDVLHGPESNAPAGTLRSFAVAGSLRPHVSQILLYREALPDGVEIEEQVIPDGALRLVFNLGEAPTAGSAPAPQALVLGPSAMPVRVRMRGAIEGFSIALRHGAAAALFGVSAGALAGSALPLDELWRGTSELLERLALASSDAARVCLIEGELQRRLAAEQQHSRAHSREAARAAQSIAISGGRRALREVASELGVGERRLQQLFATHVGLPPRTWSRLARMHGVLRSLRTQIPRRSNRQLDWAELAVTHGYYDQAHLANEFRSLCGLTPTEYFQRAIAGSSKPAP